MMKQPSHTVSDIKVVVTFERRPDGGLRAYADGVPGFVLSHSDPASLLSDVPSALSVILSARLGADVEMHPLENVETVLENAGVLQPTDSFVNVKEFVARRVA